MSYFVFSHLSSQISRKSKFALFLMRWSASRSHKSNLCSLASGPPFIMPLGDLPLVYYAFTFMVVLLGIKWYSKRGPNVWFWPFHVVKNDHHLPIAWFHPLLGLCPNMCFTRGGKGLSSGMLMIRTQTLTLAHDCWLMTCDLWLVTNYHLHAYAWTLILMTLMIITCFGMHAYWWQLRFFAD